MTKSPFLTGTKAFTAGSERDVRFCPFLLTFESDLKYVHDIHVTGQ
jgi:hypothetical protein